MKIKYKTIIGIMALIVFSGCSANTSQGSCMRSYTETFKCNLIENDDLKQTCKLNGLNICYDKNISENGTQ